MFTIFSGRLLVIVAIVVISVCGTSEEFEELDTLVMLLSRRISVAMLSSMLEFASTISRVVELLQFVPFESLEQLMPIVVATLSKIAEMSGFVCTVGHSNNTAKRLTEFPRSRRIDDSLELSSVSVMLLELSSTKFAIAWSMADTVSLLVSFMLTFPSEDDAE
jgi:hypothetical protein